MGADDELPLELPELLEPHAATNATQAPAATAVTRR